VTSGDALLATGVVTEQIPWGLLTRSRPCSKVAAVLVVATLGFLLLLAGLLRWLARNAGTRKALRRLDELQADVVAWQHAHRARMRSLERQMSDIECSVARAEEDARTAFLKMAEIRSRLLRRLEQAEQRMEIQLLVRQGRIPQEHMPEPGVPW
jgi:hypothetical protein